MLKKLYRRAFPKLPDEPDLARRNALTTGLAMGVGMVAVASEAKADLLSDAISFFTNDPEAEETSSKKKTRQKRALSESEKQKIRQRVAKQKRNELQPGEGAKASLKAWENPNRKIHTLILKRDDKVWTLDVRDLTKVDWDTFREACRDYGHKGDAPPPALFEAHKAIMLGTLINQAEMFAHPDQGVFTLGIRSCYRSEEHQREIVIRQLVREAEGGEPAGSGVTSEHCDFLAWDLNLSEEHIPEDVGFAASAAMRCRSGRYPGDGFFHTGNSESFTFWSKGDRATRTLVENCRSIVADFKKRRPKRTIKDPTPIQQAEPQIAQAETVQKLPEPKQPRFAQANTADAPRMQKASFTKTEAPSTVAKGTSTSGLEPITNTAPKPLVEVPLETALNPENAPLVFDPKAVDAFALTTTPEPSSTQKAAFVFLGR